MFRSEFGPGGAAVPQFGLGGAPIPQLSPGEAPVLQVGPGGAPIHRAPSHLESLLILKALPSAETLRDHPPFNSPTPRAWVDERRRGSHKRSASCGSTDQLKEIAKLRQQLQRSKRSSRHRRDKDRKSPFNGNHTIIQSQSQMPKTILIPIPISKSTPPRFRNSIEGLNQEIERIIIRDTVERDEIIVNMKENVHLSTSPNEKKNAVSSLEKSHRKFLMGTVRPLLSPSAAAAHAVLTTDAIQRRAQAVPVSKRQQRVTSVRPVLSILNDTVGSSPLDDTLNESKERDLGPWSPLPKYASSPKPNNSYMFKREPPEGCERVKAFEEIQPRPLQEIPPYLCPDRNKVNFIPKSGSAFCLVSILKPLLPTQELNFRSGVGYRSMSPSLVPLGGVAVRSLSPSMGPVLSRGRQSPCLPRHLEEPEG
ncbi:hypothetical protein cypCar_00005513 [Cyprinus carpio]|nr:hypothetical protein cypCar_00005513 [Cyprinus carpio]